MKKSEYEIELKVNSCFLKKSCAICSEVGEPDIPFYSFIRGTNKPVCEDCTQTHAPELAAILTTFYNVPGNMEYFRSLPNKAQNSSAHNENIPTAEYDYVIAVQPGYAVDSFKENKLHWLLGFKVYNTAGMTDRNHTVIVPIVEYRGDPTSMIIRKTHEHSSNNKLPF